MTSVFDALMKNVTTGGDDLSTLSASPSVTLAQLGDNHHPTIPETTGILEYTPSFVDIVACVREEKHSRCHLSMPKRRNPLILCPHAQATMSTTAREAGSRKELNRCWHRSVLDRFLRNKFDPPHCLLPDTVIGCKAFFHHLQNSIRKEKDHVKRATTNRHRRCSSLFDAEDRRELGTNDVGAEIGNGRG